MFLYGGVCYTVFFLDEEKTRCYRNVTQRKDAENRTKGSHKATKNP